MGKAKKFQGSDARYGSIETMFGLLKCDFDTLEGIFSNTMDVLPAANQAIMCSFNVGQLWRSWIRHGRSGRVNSGELVAATVAHVGYLRSFLWKRFNRRSAIILHARKIPDFPGMDPSLEVRTWWKSELDLLEVFCNYLPRVYTLWEDYTSLASDWRIRNVFCLKNESTVGAWIAVGYGLGTKNIPYLLDNGYALNLRGKNTKMYNRDAVRSATPSGLSWAIFASHIGDARNDMTSASWPKLAEKTFARLVLKHPEVSWGNPNALNAFRPGMGDRFKFNYELYRPAVADAAKESLMQKEIAVHFASKPELTDPEGLEAAVRKFFPQYSIDLRNLSCGWI